MPMTAQIGHDRAAVGKRDLDLPGAVSRDARNTAVPQASVDALAACRACDDLGDLLRHAAHQDARLRLDDRDAGAALARACRELEPDEAAADDRDVAAGAEMRRGCASASAKVRR